MYVMHIRQVKVKRKVKLLKLKVSKLRRQIEIEIDLTFDVIILNGCGRVRGLFHLRTGC